MRAVIQRVTHASVTVEGSITGEIGPGLLIFLGIENRDVAEDIIWLSSKIVNLRIFNDDAQMMNLSIKDTGGSILLVSQFTLYAATKKGNRPSFGNAAKPDYATHIYEQFIAILTEDLGKPLQTGIFGADMKVALLNDGPVTIIIDTKAKE